MTDIVRIFAGYDPNEAAGYHTFCHSVITRSSLPVCITPIAKNTFSWWKREGEDNGATEFSFSRFLVPYLCNHRGHALFMDGADMLCLGDIAELWALRSGRHAVQVVKHPPYDANTEKMWHQANRNYPRKNWSSVMLFNCEWHHTHELTPENVATKPGSWLHQFSWTNDERIGELPADWNVLVGHDRLEERSKLLHFTNGLPDIRHDDDWANMIWYEERAKMNHITGLE